MLEQQDGVLKRLAQAGLRNQAVTYSDIDNGWGLLYESHPKRKLRVINKRYSQRIERLNLNRKHAVYKELNL